MPLVMSLVREAYYKALEAYQRAVEALPEKEGWEKERAAYYSLGSSRGVWGKHSLSAWTAYNAVEQALPEREIYKKALEAYKNEMQKMTVEELESLFSNK